MGNQEYSDDEIDLRDYIEIMIKRKKIILTVFLLCVIIATVISFLTPKTYEATTTIEIGSIVTPISSSTPLISKDEAIQKLQTKKILSSVIQKLNLSIDESILIKTEDIKKTNFIKLKVQHTNPDLAVKICNAIADFFVLQEKETYDKKLTLLNEQMEILKKRKEIAGKEMEKLNQMLLSEATNSNFSLTQDTLSRYETIFFQLNERIYSLRKELIDSRQFGIWEPAVTAQNIKPNKKLNITISAILGLMLGVFAAFFQEFWDKTQERV